MKFLVPIIIFTILFTTPSFADLVQYSSTTELVDGSTTHNSILLAFNGLHNGKVSVLLDNPANLRIDYSGCIASITTFGTNVICDVDIASGERLNIKIDYDSNNEIRSVNGHMVFTKSIKLPLDAESAFIVVKLPEGTGLIMGDDSLLPSDATISSDGRRTIISWQRNNLVRGDVFEGSVAFESIGIAVPSVPPEMFAVVAIISFIAAGMFYRFYWKARSVDVIMPVLRKDEKDIFNSILKHGNEVNQKVIVKDSGYSKAKVSKVLNSLKERGLIKLERIGRSNKVQIEKNFRNKA